MTITNSVLVGGGKDESRPIPCSRGLVKNKTHQERGQVAAGWIKTHQNAKKLSIGLLNGVLFKVGIADEHWGVLCMGQCKVGVFGVGPLTALVSREFGLPTGITVGAVYGFVIPGADECAAVGVVGVFNRRVCAEDEKEIGAASGEEKDA